MDDKNIYKIVLNYINIGSLDEHVENDSTYTFYVDNREINDSQNEPIENFARRRLGQYFEYYYNCGEKRKLWSTIEIMVHWDRKNDVAHEITTGTIVPLLILNDGKKEEVDLAVYNQYLKPSGLGYFGEVKSKPWTEPSTERLEELKAYFKEHSDHNLFCSQLNAIFEQSKKYMTNCVIVMTNNIKNHQVEIENISNAVEDLMFGLTHEQNIKETPKRKKKVILENYA